MLTLDEATSRCWAEVDLGRLRENYHNALKHLHRGVRLIAVLKANAYGLGAAFQTGRETHFYCDVERSAGSDFHKDWQWNVGFRYNF